MQIIIEDQISFIGTVSIHSYLDILMGNKYIIDLDGRWREI